MSTNNERQKILNQQLLRAAQGQGALEDLLTNEEFRDPNDNESFLFDINCRDVLQNTPLHLAVRNGSIEDVQLLIEANGCDVDLENADGDTPLHLAVQIRDPEVDRHAIVYALVKEAGAVHSISVKNKYRQTPKDLCQNDPEILELLLESSRPPPRKALDVDDIASDGEEGSGSGSGSE